MQGTDDSNTLSDKNIPLASDGRRDVPDSGDLRPEPLPDKNLPKKPLPLHKRLLRLAPVRVFTGFIGGSISMTILCAMALFLYFATINVPVEQLGERVRQASEETLGFVFPDYAVQVGAVGLDYDPAVKGWMKINDIVLIDPVNNRSIDIREFRITPSIRGLITGKFLFDYIGIERTEISFRLSDADQRKRFVYPINLLDIPAKVLRTNGRVQINEMKLQLIHPNGQELGAVDNLSAELVKSNDGYDARVVARHANSDRGAFSFRAQRIGQEISWKGNAREYSITPDQELKMDFDLDLVFDNITQYDLTEQSDNILYPYRYLSAGTGLLRVKYKDWEGGGNYLFDPETRVLTLAQMQAGNGDFNFEGQIDATIDDEMIITGSNIKLRYPTNVGFAEFDGFGFASKLDLLKRNLNIAQFHVSNDQIKLQGAAQVSFDDAVRGSAYASTASVTADKVIDYWPQAVGEKPYVWIFENFDNATLHNVRFDLAYSDGLKYELGFEATDTVLKPTKWLPKLATDKAFFRLTDQMMYAKVEQAQTAPSEKTNVKFSDISYFVADTKTKPWIAKVNAQFEGSASDVVKTLSADPIALPSRINFAANQFKGDVSGSIQAEFPMKKGTTLGQTQIAVKANARNFVLANVMGKRGVSSQNLDIEVTQTGAKLSGLASLGQLTGKADIGISFARGSSPNIQASGNATRSQLASIGVSLPSLFTGDGVGYDVKIIPSKGNLKIIGKADISNIGLSLPGVGTVKRKGNSGTADFEVAVNGNAVTVSPLKVRSGNLNVAADLKMNNGQMTSLSIPKVNLAGIYSGEVSMSNTSSLLLKNGTLNVGVLDLAGGGSGGGSKFTLKLQNIDAKLSNTISVASVNGDITLSNGVNGRVSGLLGGRTAVDTQISGSGSNMKITLNTNDAGGFLRNAGLFADLYGGKMTAKFKTTPTKGLYAGNFDMRNVTVSNSRTAVQLLQAASIFGILENKGIKFDQVAGDVLVYPNQIELFSGRAYGQSLGLTLGGSYSTTAKRAHFTGVITPAYLVNGAFQRIPKLGELLGGNTGEGIFGVTYQIQGSAPNFSISANPLSLLTPGKLREIWSNVPQTRSIPQQYRVD